MFKSDLNAKDIVVCLFCTTDIGCWNKALKHKALKSNIWHKMPPKERRAHRGKRMRKTGINACQNFNHQKITLKKIKQERKVIYQVCGKIIHPFTYHFFKIAHRFCMFLKSNIAISAIYASLLTLESKAWAALTEPICILKPIR